MQFLLYSGFLLSSALAVQASLVFQDGFEAATLSGQWTIDTTNAGRVAIDTQYEPAAGLRHLILDDSVSDAISSVAEAVLRLDLAHKRNVVLSFKAKSIGNEPDAAPSGDPVVARTFDGVSISLDQGATWHLVRSLAALSATWESVVIGLDAAVVPFGAFGPDFRIRFSAYDNAPAPVDGIAIDDVSVTADEAQRVLIEVPSQLVEGSNPNTGYVVLAFAPTNALILDLTASGPGQLDLPATVTVPAGETGASFSFSVPDDSLLNLTRTVTVRAMAPGVASTPGTITILDNETAIATLVLPAQLVEGATPTGNARLSFDLAPSVPVTVTLSATPAGELTLPVNVTVPAAQTQVWFTVRATNDTRIDGEVVVGVTANGGPMVPVTVQTTAVDDETRTLALTLPASLVEGATGAGSLKIPGTLPTDLMVTLKSPDEEVQMPANVTIKAGRTESAFAVSSTDNTRRDGTRSVGVEATAVTFVASTREITIRDNDPATYRFDPLNDLVNVSSPVAVNLVALDIEGNMLTGLAGSVNLSVALPDGTGLALTPPEVALVQGKWTGSARLPALTSVPLRLRATDAAGTGGESNFFDITRVLGLAADDLVWDGPRDRLYASALAVPGATYGNRVVAIDPSSLLIVGSSPALPRPGQLVLTDGGEFLYAALDENGTVAKIDPATLAVISTFEIGSIPVYGALTADDMCTVPGQPNLLVVSQGISGLTLAHNGIAVYDNGVARSLKTAGNLPSILIEPSADPTLFFGLSNQWPDLGFRRLRLTSEGMTQIDVTDRLLDDGSGMDFRSAGDLVLSNSGITADGARLQRTGRFGTEGGQVCPDLATQRVFFVEHYFSSVLFDSLAAFDPTSFSLIRRSTLPEPVHGAGALVRWGSDGLAFRTVDSVVLVNSTQFVPRAPSADLSIMIEATPNPYPDWMVATYTVRVTNEGPNPARWVSLTGLLTGGTLHTAVASRGSLVQSGAGASWSLPELPVNASEVLTLQTLPQSGQIMPLIAAVSAGSIDPDLTNNRAAKVVVPEFKLQPDAAVVWPFPANNVIYDARRQVLWVTVPAAYGLPMGGSLMSFSPVTGLVSDPIPLNGEPLRNVIALSANGRYLYVGLGGLPVVSRTDLEANPPKSVHLQLGTNGFDRPNHAADLEVLDGDGTSFLMTGSEDNAAVVFDGSVPRELRTSALSAVRIEPTADPRWFVSWDGNRWLRRLEVSATGVSSSQEGLEHPMHFAIPDIAGSGNYLLSSKGLLADSLALSPVIDFAIEGRPCLDPANHRAYLLRGNRLHGFDTATGAPIGELPVPTAETSDWAGKCIRWGLDGFAILDWQSPFSEPLIARWSKAIREGADLNDNGVSDAWEAANLGPFGGNLQGDPDGDRIASALEYLFGTSPFQASAHPLQMNVSSDGALRLAFPRRAGLPSGFYGFETSADLQLWTPATGVHESILSTQVIDGVTLEAVEATIPWANPESGFVHIRWPKP